MQTTDGQSLESGIQLFSRVSQNHLLDGFNPNLFPVGGPYSNQVIDLVFEHDAEKPDLLIDCIVRCILPSQHNQEWKGSGAVLVNSTFHINLMAIISVMNAVLKKHNIPNIKSVIKDSLKLLTILNCYDPEQTKLTYLNLEKVLQTKDNIALVVIDNVTSHYWIEKVSNPMLSLYQHAKKMFEMLYSVVKAQNLTLLFSRIEREITKKTVSPNVDFKIVVHKISDENFKATVLDFSKQHEYSVSFRLGVFVEYLN